MDFVERLERRRAVWWQRHLRLADPRTYRPWIHARRDMSLRLRADDVDERWRCCDAWPRKLLNKWNAREFAVRHGTPVPELYCYAEGPHDVPLETMPDRYVVRPLRGTVRQGVLVIVDGVDLLSRQPLAPADVRTRLEAGRGHAAGPYLIERFIEREGGSAELPIEYKCHTFGARVAAIQRIDRAHGGEMGATQRYYQPDWSPFDDLMSDALPLTAPVPPPPFLDTVVETASRLGHAVGTYIRVDIFGSFSGIVFDEFASTPEIKRPRFTPYCRELFGTMWDTAFPDAV